eukprot:2518368-Rhodomonas_salina.1
MAAAAVAAISAASGDDALVSRTPEGKGAPARKSCTLQLPPGPHWIKSGLLYKHVHGHVDPWHPRRVVLTSEFLCITRPHSTDVIERLELKTVRGIGPYHPSEDPVAQPKARRGSAASVEDVLKNANRDDKKNVLQPPDKPAFQFKTTDEHGTKRRFCFGATTQSEIEEWLESLKGAMKQVEDRAMKTDKWGRIQIRTKKIYDSRIVQSLIALLIIGNFAMAI